MAFLRAAYSSSCSDDETPSLQFSTTSETSTFEIVTPCPSITSVLSSLDPLKSTLLSQGQEGLCCCCVSVDDLHNSQSDLPFTGWEGRRMDDSGHATSSQDLETSLVLLSLDSSCKPPIHTEKTSKSHLSSKERGSIGSSVLEPKSQVRKFIHHTSLSPEIPYIFRHHDMSEGDTSQFMEDYRCCYTYPNMEEKSKKMSSVICAAPSVTTIRPTLFVLGGGGQITHQSKEMWHAQEGFELKAQSDSFMVCHSPLQQHHITTTPVVNTTNCKPPKVTGSASPHTFGHGNRHRDLGVPRNTYKTRSAKVAQGSNTSGASPKKDDRTTQGQGQGCNSKTDGSICSVDGQKIDIAAFAQMDSVNFLSRPSSSSPSTLRQKKPFFTTTTPQPTNLTPPRHRNEHKKPPRHRKTLEHEFQVKQSL